MPRRKFLVLATVLLLLPASSHALFMTLYREYFTRSYLQSGLTAETAAFQSYARDLANSASAGAQAGGALQRWYVALVDEEFLPGLYHTIADTIYNYYLYVAYSNPANLIAILEEGRTTYFAYTGLRDRLEIELPLATEQALNAWLAATAAGTMPEVYQKEGGNLLAYGAYQIEISAANNIFAKGQLAYDLWTSYSAPYFATYSYLISVAAYNQGVGGALENSARLSALAAAWPNTPDQVALDRYLASITDYYNGIADYYYAWGGYYRYLSGVYED